MFVNSMNSFRWRTALFGLCLAFSFSLSHTAALAQAGGKTYLSPELFLGITSGQDYNKGLDFSNLNRSVRLELRGGYWLSKQVSLFTGFGYASYRYRMVAQPIVTGPDTIRSQKQECWEVPLGVRFSTYYGDKSVRTRYYAALGIRGCFLSDARHDARTPNGEYADVNIVRPQDFNHFWVRMFAEGGLDIPMDYGSAILIGVSVSNGLSRNANTEGALSKNNYGVLVVGGSIGLRIGLTAEKPVRRRLQSGALYK